MADVSRDIVSELAPSGTLRAAINFGNSVLAQKHPSGGEPQGVSPALARELAKRLGVSISYVPFDAAGKVTDAGKAGAWDVCFLAVDPVRATGIAFTAGILIGAFVVALAHGELKWVGFEQPSDMLRYAGGAALMGAGGVMALGCTIGNGLTGVASLAPVSFIAVPTMVLAAAATMKWRWRRNA